MKEKNEGEDKKRDKCPLCGCAMEDPEECQYCDYKRRSYIQSQSQEN